MLVVVMLDDGENVFNYYQNFKGTVYPTGWTTDDLSTTQYVQVHNGFTIGFTDEVPAIVPVVFVITVPAGVE